MQRQLPDKPPTPTTRETVAPAFFLYDDAGSLSFRISLHCDLSLPSSLLCSFMFPVLLSSLISSSLSLSPSVKPHAFSSLFSFHLSDLRSPQLASLSLDQTLLLWLLNCKFLTLELPRVSSSSFPAAIVDKGEDESVLSCEARASCGQPRSPPPTAGSEVSLGNEERASGSLGG